MNLREKLKHNIDTITSKYFLDLTRANLGDGKGTVVNAFNYTLLTLGYALKKNMLLMGEPGIGKTTASALVGSSCLMLPYDLMRSIIMPGHEDQTEEKTIGRPDYGALMDKREEVVWQKALYFPLVQLDEFNRLPVGKQALFLDFVATGRATYLNEVFYDGEKSFFATINYKPGINNGIDAAARDRFHLSVEMGPVGSPYLKMLDAFNKRKNIEMANRDLTNDILELIQDKGTNFQHKMRLIDEKAAENAKGFSKRTGLEHITSDEFGQIESGILGMELTSDADLYWQMIHSELTSTALYGIKRSNDPVDDSTHGKELASYNTLNSLSPRGANESILDFAKALAWYTGAKKVTKAHIDAVAPHALAHRLTYSEDYKSTHNIDQRNCAFDTHLSRVLLEGISANFDKYKNPLLMLIEYVSLKNGQVDRELEAKVKRNLPEIKSILEGGTAAQHPMMRDYINTINENYPL